jgi:transcriptional regulator with PAS, ATPase and Fis domain
MSSTSAFDSFSGLFENKKEKKIVKKPVNKTTIKDSKPKISLKETNEEIKKLEEKQQQIIIEETYEEMPEEQLNIARALQIFRKLKSFLEASFFKKFIIELNTRLDQYQKRMEDRFNEISYNKYMSQPTAPISFGGSSSQTIVNNITQGGGETEKYYNNSVSQILSGDVVVLSENDLLDSQTTISKAVSDNIEPLGIAKENISVDAEGSVVTFGTIETSFSTLDLPLGTFIFLGEDGSLNSYGGQWIIGKTVNKSLSGKIYVKIQKNNIRSLEAEYVGLPQL